MSKGSPYRRAVHRQPRRQARYCAYCGRRFQGEGKLQRTRDHRVPKSWGGQGRRNMVAACLECNNEKGSTVWKVKYHPFYGYAYDKEIRKNGQIENS